MTAFEPLFRNPHCQTIAGHLWPRPALPAGVEIRRQLFRTEPDVQVLVESVYPAGKPCGSIVMVHGLEGSSRSGYVQSLAARALRAGFAAHGFNMRTCGGTERLCTTLYHAGLTSDLRYVLERLREEDGELFLAGFSLGGNVVLKLAGELGETGPDWIQGVCAVSAPLDLEACSRRIGHIENRVYERRFVRRMVARLCATGRYGRTDFEGLRSVMDIDDRMTAPSFGFGSAENYYRSQSALRYLPSVRVPVLLIQAKDDTFIPIEVFDSEPVRSNPSIRVMATQHGGHLGFLGRGSRRFWADEAIMNWIENQTTRNVLSISNRTMP
jgi:uncharacterized protein